MIKLFTYEGYKFTISPEAFALAPFRKIWNRDRSEKKEQAYMELGYIYFFCDPRSDYMYHVDETDRNDAIKEGEGLPKSWKPDRIIQEAIDFYLSFKTVSMFLLEDTRLLANKLRMYLRDIDLNETDDKGKPIHTLNTVTSTIKQIPELLSSLDKAEKALASEMKIDGKMRGQREKTIFEDDLNG